MKQIIVEVEPDGAVTIDAVGFTGTDCVAATQFLEEALGAKTQVQTKPEFHQRRVNGQRQYLGKKSQ